MENFRYKIETKYKVIMIKTRIETKQKDKYNRKNNKRNTNFKLRIKTLE